MNVFLKQLVVGIGLITILGVFTGELSAQRIRLEAKLVSTGIERFASGKARFEMKRGRMKFSTEAEDLLVSKMIEVSVDGQVAGFALVDIFGTADLNLDTDLGDKVPRARDGSLVEVRDSNGRLLLFGVLEGEGRAD